MTPDEQAKQGKSAGRPLGPIGEAVRSNIKSIREGQGLSQAELSANLTNLGRPIPPLGIHRIEAGTRRVDVDDLVALAVALTTTPATLLMPNIGSVQPDEQVQLGEVPPTVSARRAWRWITARDRINNVRLTAFIGRSWPGWEQDEYWDRIGGDLQDQLWPEPEGDSGGNDQ